MRRISYLAVALVALFSTQAYPSFPSAAGDKVILHTDAGDILLVLYPDVAPRHVEQFLRLVRLGVYDTTHFYRVEPGFVIQLSTADDRLAPLTEQQRANIRAIPAEFGSVAHTPGVLSMARQLNDPDSAETSFSILLAKAPHLDGRYTVFGHVEEGIDVVKEILRVPRRTNHSPVVRIQVTKAEVVEPGSTSPLLVAARAIEVDRGLLWRDLDEAAVGSTDVWPSPWRLLPVADPILLAGLAALTIGSLTIYGLARRLPPNMVMSIALINALVAGFVLFAVLAPMAATSDTLAALLFVGWLGLIRLMGRFECAN